MRRGFGGRVWLAAALLAGTLGVAGGAETWRGLVVAPEHRCSPYDRARDYPYAQAIERDIVRRLGAVVGPYTGTCFGSTDQTDIEHIVATSEAHDSGLCARDRATRARFAADLRNLTLAAPRLNRHQKRDKDAAEWLPARNRCWFAATVVAVRRAYGLTIDRDEAVLRWVILFGNLYDGSVGGLLHQFDAAQAIRLAHVTLARNRNDAVIAGAKPPTPFLPGILIDFKLHGGSPMEKSEYRTFLCRYNFEGKVWASTSWPGVSRTPSAACGPSSTAP